MLFKKNLGSVDIIILFFLLSVKPEIVVLPGSRIQYFIFEISGKPSFVEALNFDKNGRSIDKNMNRHSPMPRG
jgi:hypothetical protein